WNQTTNRTVRAWAIAWIIIVTGRTTTATRAEASMGLELIRCAQAERGGFHPHPAWPLERPRCWLALVNAPETEAELEALRRSVRRGCPFGEQSWSDETVRQLGLEMTVRPQGRHKKERNTS